MIFKSLTLINYGPFPGKQHLDLMPIGKDKPIILIGGMNGSGKTSILDAIQLLFFGKRANCTGRKPLSYNNYLKECIHRGAPEATTSIELVFEQWTGGVKEEIQVTRSWFLKGREVKESLIVIRNGKLDRFLSSSWNDVVEGYLPFGVSHLFFFNGEKIKELADVTESAGIIRTAIHSLLGADIIDKLIADLHTLERKKSVSTLSSEQKNFIDNIRKKIVELKVEQDASKMERVEQEKKVKALLKQLKKINIKFTNEGGELFEKRAVIETDFLNIGKQFQQLQEELRILAAGTLPLLFARSLMEQTSLKAEKELDIQLQKRVISLLSKRDKTLIKDLQEKADFGEKQLKQIQLFLANDLETRSDIASSDAYLGLTATETHKIKYLKQEGIPNQLHIAQDLLDQHEILERKLSDLERAISAVPEEDKIAIIIDSRDAIKLDLAKSETDLSSIIAHQTELRKKVNETQVTLTNQIKKLVQFDSDNEDIRRVVRSSILSRQILNSFRKRIVKKNLSRIEKLAYESSSELFRKSNLITDISINLENYALSLKGSDGKPLYNAKLSEGERQLLAVSLLWGLAKASEYPLPAIIDSPLGRLDSTHRIRLVDKYFPKASHQVILLSTDEEVTKTYFKRMKPWISKTYHLEHKRNSNETIIKDGYFPWFGGK